MAAEIVLDDGTRATASVPAGKSVGSKEDKTVSADLAVQNIEQIIAPVLKGFDILDQEKLDDKLIELDGTTDKSKLGANAILAVSLVTARVAAHALNIPLWKHINNLAGGEVQMPRLLVNLINGGAHSGSSLPFQEYLIIPDTREMSQAVEIAHQFYEALKNVLVEKLGSEAVGVGDEGGFAPNLSDNSAPFALFNEVISKLEPKSGVKINFGLDAAANNLKLSNLELKTFYNKIFTDFPITYLEDPFGETDLQSFNELLAQYGARAKIVGDDLTTTDPQIIADPKLKQAINGVIIKPNQIGTLTETLAAVRQARINGWGVFVSHRSGETNDTFIADLACAVAADGFKLGAPARGERVAKYNRLLEIEHEVSSTWLLYHFRVHCG